MLNQNNPKKQAAEAALQFIPENAMIGVGTGTTVHYFIEALTKIKHILAGTVASSEATAKALKAIGVPVYDLNTVSELAFYVDGADEVNPYFQMIKGGGGALTREKILACVAPVFICIVDESKLVPALGQFPLPIEVIPMARSFVAREIVKLGGDPVYRQGVITDNGNIILDVHHLSMAEPIRLEESLNQITGIVTHGLFAKRTADRVLVGKETGVEILKHARLPL